MGVRYTIIQHGFTSHKRAHTARYHCRNVIFFWGFFYTVEPFRLETSPSILSVRCSGFPINSSKRFLHPFWTKSPSRSFKRSLSYRVRIQYRRNKSAFRFLRVHASPIVVFPFILFFVVENFTKSIRLVHIWAKWISISKKHLQKTYRPTILRLLLRSLNRSGCQGVTIWSEQNRSK